MVFAKPGVHLIVTCSKTKQTSGQVQVVELPSLPNKVIFPVQALKWLLTKSQNNKTDPLFQIQTTNEWVPLTASNVRSFLRLIVVTLGWNPSPYTFHAFRCSGASLAFDNNVEFYKIKQHGHWRSEAIWAYLNTTPTAARYSTNYISMYYTEYLNIWRLAVIIRIIINLVTFKCYTN